MSVRMMSLVFSSYEGGGSEMLLALALADHADDNGENIFPSVAYLAQKTRQSPRTVQRQLSDMTDAGWLLVVTPGGHGKRSSTRYRINPAWIQACLVTLAKGDNLSPLEPPKGDTAMSPKEPPKGDKNDALGCHGERLRVTQLCHPNHQETSRTTSSSSEPTQPAPPEPVPRPSAAAVDPLGGGKTEIVIQAMAQELEAGRVIVNPAAFAARICGDKRHISERWGQDLLGWAQARVAIGEQQREEERADAERRQEEAYRRSEQEGLRRLAELERAR